jgi:hypothetical protein
MVHHAPEKGFHAMLKRKAGGDHLHRPAADPAAVDRSYAFFERAWKRVLDPLAAACRDQAARLTS